ncbi:hypothetical protein SAMN05216289_12849 [Dokdonella immobilis]|uniref:Uncharacterized protein n=1 Tax=Dokdonella immobilis TaxID=578942 RepID=A0A1I4ZSR5_9GAMM|nr:hypothetical protein SAMN05216289_12849 [Dokdonella immobilis]
MVTVQPLIKQFYTLEVWPGLLVILHKNIFVGHRNRLTPSTAAASSLFWGGLMLDAKAPGNNTASMPSPIRALA